MNILFDFDGVIIDSMPVREKAFAYAVESYSKENIIEFIEFHKANGGMSRFIKFKYFINNIIKEDCNKDKIAFLAERYSDYVNSHLVSKNKLIETVLKFIIEQYQKYPMYIISASEHKELNYICEKLDIAKYFKKIYGTPPLEKSKLMKLVLKRHKIAKRHAVYIGDSINDLEASIDNNIKFFGFNNPELKNREKATYIESIDQVLSYFNE
ncbi:MAG: HAD-IA family hydrolase [Spirochaetia bacterium]|nr:HAD-IA family hydrolase [Spirochaetia bacterium]